VALDLDQQEVQLVRLKQRRRGLPLLEAHQRRELPEAVLPASIFEPVSIKAQGLSDQLHNLFESTGTRPGRVSLVLPDNLAKITLVTLPERPANARQLEELVRAKMRRAVPFRLDDAALAWQLLPGEGRQVGVLVVLLRRATVERLERSIEKAGGRPGLIDIATPNVINLCRAQLDAASHDGGDAALLNCSPRYFSLVILRQGKLIFFRCKTFAPGAQNGGAPNGALAREVMNSFSYYREKLAGEGVRTLLVRSAGAPADQVVARLQGLGCERVEPVDVVRAVELGEGVRLDAEQGQRLAPALGAAAARRG
jgi:type IV pilus assembly protein PilM